MSRAGCAIRTDRRAAQLLGEHQQSLYRRTDRLLAALMAVQWLVATAAALWLSPRTWEGPFSQIHIHVWAALFLGGAVSFFPILLVFLYPGQVLTRCVIAAAQMVMSGLLIQLSGGRIETHFHVFGSLAFLACYRDWRVLVVATAVVAADHYLRGLFWPQSVYGILLASEWRWLEHAGWVVFEDSILVVACCRSTREMREIARRTAEIEGSEERYRAFIGQSSEGIWRLEVQHPIPIDLPEDDQLQALCRDAYLAECNHAMARMYGFASASEPVGTRLGEFLEHADPSSPEFLRAFIRSGYRLENAESHTLDQNGSPTCILHNLVGIIEEGCLVRAWGTQQNITERKLAERALRESEERFHAFMDNSPTVAFMKDAEGRLVYVNRPFEETFGTTLPEVRGKTDYDLFPSKVAEGLRATDRAVLESGEPLETHETVPVSDGQQRDWLVYKFPVRLGSGKVFLGGIGADVTERRQLEEQLRHSQKMEAVGRLAGGVAHDFNNMLAVINGYSELALNRLSPGHPLHSPLEQVHAAGERAAELTRHLLAFSRKQVLEPRLLDLNHGVARMDKMLHRLIGEDIELVTHLASAPAPVVADPCQVEQVLMNLAVNARDAMPEGGKLTIEVHEVTLEQSYGREHREVTPGSYVMLAVSDTGIGMDEVTQARIFEPFFTTKDVGQGTGLGLSTVYGIVQQSGGSICVYSELGQGTTFKIYLPRAADAPDHQRDPAREVSRGTETILLLEDEAMVRNMIRTALEASGFRVVEAASSEDAVSLCRDHRDTINLLLTDVVMPQMSGREVAEAVGRHSPDLKVLFMSGYTDDAAVRHGVLHAEAHFIPKPFSLPDLTRKLREVLDS
jgi:PAS domain S-box-containing protein